MTALPRFFFLKEASKKKGAVLVQRTMARTTCHVWEFTQAFSRQRLGRSGFLSRRHFQDDWEPFPPDDQAPERWVKKLSYRPQTGSLRACNTENKQSVPASGAPFPLKTLLSPALPTLPLGNHRFLGQKATTNGCSGLGKPAQAAAPNRHHSPLRPPQNPKRFPGQRELS